MVYRTGDQIGAWSFAGIAALGLGSTAVAVTAVPLSAAWLLNSLWLGRRQEARRVAMEEAEGSGKDRATGPSRDR